MENQYKPITAFYAFPSDPPSLKETILEAIKVINKKQTVNIVPWTELNNVGKVIIEKVLSQIDASDLFLCDVSSLNPNVFFELGYAIAKKKPIWLTIDGTDKKNEILVKRFDIISNIGYKKHINSDDIVSEFFKSKPFDDLQDNLLQKYKGIIDANEQNKNNTDILYCKSPLEHTASKKLTRFIQNLNRKIIELDYLENSYQPFETILTSVIKSKILVAHLANDIFPEKQLVNARYSLFSGLSIGFNKETLLLAPTPYETPLDYRNLLLKHSTASECEEHIKNWILPILARGEEISKEFLKSEINQSKNKELTLIKFVLGDGQAEHEKDLLNSFFIETSIYNIGLKTNLALFVGRKGTGKTANLLKIQDHFENLDNYLVVLIKPFSFKLESFIKLIENYFSELDSKTELIEKIWEFVVYTSIAQEVYLKLIDKPKFYNFPDEEKKFIEYIEINSEVMSSDFGEKIYYILNKVEELISSGSNPKYIIEYLYNKYFKELKIHLNNIKNKYTQIVVLVDNLDKAWEYGRNSEIQCSIIYGLLGFYNSFVKNIQMKQENVKLLVFLREDIFNAVQYFAREPDKILLTTHKIDWNDKSLLLRVIEERFLAYDINLKNKVWSELFCEKINDTPVQDYIFNNIIPRPRDLIYFVQSAINESINHLHTKLESSDIKSAQKQYFEFLFQNTITEYQFVVSNLKEILLSFYGSERIFNLSSLKKKLKIFEFKDVDLIVLIRLLISISFLGLKINDQYKFAYSDRDSENLFYYFTKENKKFFNSKITFQIHPAFYVGLIP